MSSMHLKIADNMEKYGGDFAKALAECIRRADPLNLVKLRDAFPQEFQSYHPSQWVRREKNENN